MLTVLAVLVSSALGGSVDVTPARNAWDFKLGIGEQQAYMFSDPRFAALGIEHVRVVTPYDVACHPGRHLYWLDVWLAEAARVGAKPLVAFSFSWRRGRMWKLPSYKAYVKCFRAFRARFPQVREFNAWNEPNHSSQPTFRHPKKAAGYYNAVRRVCPRCTVPAGDLLDWRLDGSWLERYREHLRGRPRLWSMHNYVDINRRRGWRGSGTADLLRRTHGKVWITETGGVVRSLRNPHNERRAARATRKMFRFAWRSSRITRVYAYQWQAACGRRARWDSAWFRSDGSARPSYRVIVAQLARERGLDAAARAALNPPLGPAMRNSCKDP